MIPTHIKTLTASGDSSLAFVDGTASVVFDNTYDEYMFVLNNMNLADSSVEFGFQVNKVDDSGYDKVTTSSKFFVEHLESGGLNDGFSYDSANDQNQGTSYQTIVRECGNSANENFNGVLHIFSPSNTTYVTHFYSRIASSVVQDGSSAHFCGGYFNITEAIDEISFKPSGGNFDGVIQMYGIA